MRSQQSPTLGRCSQAPEEAEVPLRQQKSVQGASTSPFHPALGQVHTTETQSTPTAHREARTLGSRKPSLSGARRREGNLATLKALNAGASVRRERDDVRGFVEGW